MANHSSSWRVMATGSDVNLPKTSVLTSHTRLSQDPSQAKKIDEEQSVYQELDYI
jgi:hypothetical protein